MPRLFTGIEIPDDVVWHLSMLRGGLQGAQWITPENYHLTLRFLGDVCERQAAQFADALTTLHFESFDLELSGVGSFGGNKPRAIWAALKPCSALDLLQKVHERIARAIGAEPETRAFTPHITLARLRSTSTIDVADYLARHGAFFCQPFKVKRFVLFSARPHYGGGPYVIEEGYDAIDTLYDDDEAAA